MSSPPLDEMAVEIVCSCCRNQHSTTVRWLRDHSRLTCRGCGFDIALQNEELRAALTSSPTRCVASSDPCTGVDWCTDGLDGLRMLPKQDAHRMLPYRSQLSSFS